MSVARELTLFANLIPNFQDPRSGWSEEVIATDASEWGLGAVISRFDSDVVGRCGRLNERWRFRFGAGYGGARAQAGIEVVDGDMSSVLSMPSLSMPWRLLTPSPAPAAAALRKKFLQKSRAARGG